MPPTVQPNTSEDRDKRARSGERRSELLCRVKYGNTLPDIPFDPKFITYPFEANRFVGYNPTSLERNFKFDLLTEHDLGVPIDLVNPDIYSLDPSCRIAPEDERLLEEDVAAHGVSKRSRHHNKNVSWLRKTEYISTEYSRGMQKSDKVEAKVGFNIKKTFKVEDIYKDRESQLRAIEKTFAAASVPITEHYSRKGVTPISVMEVHPDYELWKHPFAQVIFDSDPAPKPETTAEEMAQAMIRGMVDESGEQFVAYFLPTVETTRKRKLDNEKGIPYGEDEEYDYMLAREYNWNVKNKASKGYEEMYFFVFRNGAAYYNELETRVRLTKRRKATAATSGARTRLVVRHRELTEQEMVTQELRRSALTEDDDEEEDGPAAEQEEDGKAHEESAGEQSRGSSSDDEGGDTSKQKVSSGRDSSSSSDDEGGDTSKQKVSSGRDSSSSSSEGSDDERANATSKPNAHSEDDGGQSGSERGSPPPQKQAKAGDDSEESGGSENEAESGDEQKSASSRSSSSGDNSGSESDDGHGKGGEGDEEKKIFGSESSSSEAEDSD